MTTRREALEAIRDRLTAEFDTAEDPRDVAMLSKELRAVWDELDAIPAAGSNAPTDEIARRREERRQRAAGQ